MWVATEALADKNLIAKKQADEDDFRKKVAANPEWQKEYGERMGHNCEGRRTGEAGDSSIRFIGEPTAGCFRLRCCLCSTRQEMKKPDGERLAQFHDANQQSLKFQLLSPAPITTDTEKLFMKTALNLGVEKLGKDDAVCAGCAAWRQRSMRQWIR